MTSPTRSDLAYYAQQSPITDPGPHAPRLAALPGDIPAVRDATRELIHYYWADGGIAEHGFAPERIAEIDLRYSSAIFSRAFELADVPLTTPRPTLQRVVGCCRDAAVTFVSIARQVGIPARVRTGFATYLIGGWKMDHVIAEAWDAREQRWRRVDAQLEDGFADPTDGEVIDPLDVATDRFISSSQAWLAARAGEIHPNLFIVAPDVDTPGTSGRQFLVHNLLTELAALNKREMLCWDSWGIFDEAADGLTAARERELDDLARAMLDPGTPVADLAARYDRPGYRVPRSVLSFSHATPVPVTVELPDWVDP
ncbi:hypothetical protein F4553_007924 [Allocatelliglobosispora scoriae]|uniref:Transglutaminase-like domain-containing protein n=1 Tax=Allocatelliglobosispora scoriae TaxID=643052 RepID=A0A841C6D3_9ACTN|nr:transglutaminase-like domain-containing protein [Allocatelliglobosispora scoriae]MBB5874490.1 hypothetical protein [Allocatelliglobosispora scoriae]